MIALSLTESQRNCIRQFDACTVANAIERFGVRLANAGFADATIRCIVPGRRPMLAYAATARLKASAVPINGRRSEERTDWYDYLLTIPEPRVLVIEDASEKPGLGAFIGEVHATILAALGCVGAVTNGAVRDLPALEAMEFPVFAGNVAISHCYAHLVDFGRPVQVGGLRVEPGDLIFGDRHGVLSIPGEIADQIPAAAERQLAEERRILDLCHSADFSVANLRALVSHRG